MAGVGGDRHGGVRGRGDDHAPAGHKADQGGDDKDEAETGEEAHANSLASFPPAGQHGLMRMLAAMLSPQRRGPAQSPSFLVAGA